MSSTGVPRTCRGRWCSPPIRWGSLAIRRSCTRRSLRGSSSSSCSGCSSAARWPAAGTAPGLLAGAFLVGYGVIRYLLEFTRQPDAQLGLVLGPFSLGQMLAMAMIILGGLLLAIVYAFRRGAPDSMPVCLRCGRERAVPHVDDPSSRIQRRLLTVWIWLSALAGVVRGNSASRITQWSIGDGGAEIPYLTRCAVFDHGHAV